MKISISLTVALQVLSILKKETSTPHSTEFLEKTLSVHPKIIHDILLCLRDTGFIQNKHRDDGWYLIKDKHLITLLDVYRAVCTLEGKLYSMYENLKFNCPIGANIQFALEMILIQAQEEMENLLESITMEQLITLLNNGNGNFK
ncbi:Rrf2 family transcriptional regulator [Bacillus cereus]|uniref:Rrf2 family transcriptional regulator n=1 Tax=Bacillus cereus TaxID=1396 RepID=A0A9X8ZQX9_BACCE|nr:MULTISPECIES: Rrf2 family transcriptional regulator [Bacillus cereus group]MCM3224027.1 Rrf2 family transcriptional regulator [Bacillus cereus]MEC3335635.1 Rrf2 family transcriptional regulator [Bacillus cereus]PFB77093.1 Rrf2 family transcriptional regulator [Bacillus thuringiensis]TKH25607.1 Rrf2 family transcriptional regulator [Bacillus cereus]TKJ00686.1 Rrf2 family transcriptional regulator [Bacillus cereus]